MSFTQCLRIIISFLQPAFIVKYCESHFLKQRGMLWQPFKSCVSLVLRCPLPDGPLCAHCVWVRQREASLRYSGWPDLGQEERHDRSEDSNSIPASTSASFDPTFQGFIGKIFQNIQSVVFAFQSIHSCHSLTDLSQKSQTCYSPQLKWGFPPSSHQLFLCLFLYFDTFT